VINKNEEKRTLEMQKNLKRIEEIFKAEKISNSQSYDRYPRLLNKKMSSYLSTKKLLKS